MKHLIVLTCCLFLFSSFIFSQQTTSKKKALIIAIGDYPAAGGWRTISSKNDVGYIKNTLMNQGFPENNIDTIINQQATLEGIKSALAKLIQRVDAGDIAVIHFSSHGEQVEADINNKVDGLDECVVTYNAIAPSKSSPANFQADQVQYLRGHVLGDYIQQLRLKLGPAGDLIVFMDNCHSGGGTRGDAKVRGGAPPFVSANFNLQNHRKSDSSMLFRTELNNMEAKGKMSSYEVFSATRPEELDTETKDKKTGIGMGSLTYAISSAFENLRADKTDPTYRVLFAKIQSIMNQTVPDQHPLLEGNGEDRLLFGGGFVHQMPYIKIAGINNADAEIDLQQGSLAGLDSGSKIAIYPSSTIDTSKAHPLATGTVYKSSAFSATAKISKRLGSTNISDAIVFVTEYAYTIDPVKIKLVSKKSAPAAAVYSNKDIGLVKSYISHYPFVNYSEEPELVIIKGDNTDSVKVDSIKVSSNGYLFSTVKDIVADSTDLISKLEAYARYKFLQKLSSHADGLNVEIMLVPFNAQHIPDTNAIQQRMLNNTFVAYERDSLALWIKNTGKKDAYVNILDMQPNGIINPILPNKKKKLPANELKFAAGQSYIYPIDKYFLKISKPFGTEVFKVFVSEQEIDLEQIATTGLAAARGGMLTALEKLIAKSYNLSKKAITAPLSLARGADGDVQVLDDTSQPEATTKEFIFQIKPKK